MSEIESSNVAFERSRGVHSLAVTRDVAHAAICIDSDAGRAEQILAIFRVLAESSVPVFLPKLHPGSVTIAIRSSDIHRLEYALASISLAAAITPALTVVSVRAASMRELSGVMVGIADALSSVGAKMYETGDSHNSVVCLIESGRAADALAALREKFALERDVVADLEAA